MTKNSLNLKKTKDALRKDQLQEYIKKYNQFLKMVRCKGQTQGDSFNALYQGMVFPFSNHDGKTYNSNLIVNFIRDEGACFETKKRVPYLIYLETVDLEDFKIY